MAVLIKQFNDGSFLEYDKGGFDNWCVYLTRPSNKRTPPLDVDYFSDLVNLGQKYSNIKIYKDFVSLYSHVRQSKVISNVGHELIEKNIVSYEESDSVDIEIIFTILYAAMVAEEQKERTMLGARIKRLGVHQILLDVPPLGVVGAAGFSRGLKWRDIDTECKKRGF